MNVGTFRGLCVAAVVAGFCTVAQGQPFTRCVTNFEPDEEFVGGDVFTGEGAQVIWQAPGFSGSTAGIVPGDDDFGNLINDSQVFFCAGPDCLPTQGYEIRFAWEDPTNSNGASGVRCTTLSTENLPSPSVHLAGKIRFKMAVTAFEFLGTSGAVIGAQIPDASILMCLGIRETGNEVAQGDSDTGGGDLEFVYLPGSEVIPAAGTNGLVTFPPGGKRFAASDIWPPVVSDFFTIEFDLAQISTLGLVRGFANNGDGTDTAGDGVLDATLSPSGEGVNRGVLESIIFTNDPSDTSGAYFFIYIDEVEFEAPEPDGALAAPTIGVPLNEGDTTVVVNTKVNLCDDSEVDYARLFINDISQGTAVPVDGQATFSSLSLVGGDLITARQVLDGTTSGLSLPALVFGPGVVVADSFDTYASQAELNLFWSDSVSNPTPADARLQLATGGAASCQNMIREFNPAGSDAARLYRFIGDQNGTDEAPLVVTWHFQHRGASGPAGERTRFELARQASSTFSASAAARLKGTTGIILENGPGTVPLPQTLDEYNILLISSTGLPTAGSNGFFAGNQGNVANTGIARVPDEWHTMQIQVTSNSINYFIDGALANPVDTNGTPLWAGGVPRPSPDPYNFIIIGQGFSNNGPEMLFDNVSITIGTNAIPFGPPNPVPSPTVVGDFLPGDMQVTVVNVDSNATEVAVSVNGAEVASTNGVGVFTDNTAVVTVPKLSPDDFIQATQTVGGIESCLSGGVLVTVPPPTVIGELVPGQTSVTVGDINEGTASVVSVYRDQGAGALVLLGSEASPATDPISVTVTALQNGWDVIATQTIVAESAPSAPVTVGVPAPTVVPPLLIGDVSVTVSDVHPTADQVTVLVNGSTVGFVDVSASSAPTVIVPVAPALAVDDQVTATQEILGVTGPESAPVDVSLPICLVAFEDRFETDTSANWNVLVLDEAATNDALATFNYPYTTSNGVPPAPNGPATGFGLKIEANQSDAGAVPEAAGVTVSPVGVALDTTGYRLVLDMWMNVAFPQSGSTEFMGFGVGFDNVTPLLAEANGSVTNAASGDGAWFLLSGETGAAQDVRAYKDTIVQAPASGQFAAGTDVTAQFADANPLYTNLFGTPTVPDEQIAIDIGQTSGSPGLGWAAFAWHEVDITVLGGKARWSVDDTTFVTLDNAVTQQLDLSGNVAITYQDVFDSVVNFPRWNFGLADNVRVLVSHTPGIAGDFDGDADVDLDDVDYLVDCISGPLSSPDPSTGLTCAPICLQVFDFDDDDDVDLVDYSNFQLFFNP